MVTDFTQKIRFLVSFEKDIILAFFIKTNLKRWHIHMKIQVLSPTLLLIPRV